MYNVLMIIAVDDSGDAGFKFGCGSSDYFAIAAVYFDDDLDAEEIGLKVKRLRQERNWAQTVEFKFRKTSEANKIRFFSAIDMIDYPVVISLIDKRKITDSGYKKNSSSFYNAVILATLKAIPIKLKKAHIYIDGEAGTDYRQKAKTLFRQGLPKNAITKVTYVDSQKDNLIQIADMIAGAVMLSTDLSKDHHDQYLNLIKQHIVKVNYII